MGEVDFDAGFFRQPRMLGHFATLIVGERAPHLPIEALQERAEAVGAGLCGAVFEFHKRDVKTPALDQRSHLRTVAISLDVVAFPVAGDETFCNVGGALVDADHTGNLSAPVNAACAP